MNVYLINNMKKIFLRRAKDKKNRGNQRRCDIYRDIIFEDLAN